MGLDYQQARIRKQAVHVPRVVIAEDDLSSIAILEKSFQQLGITTVSCRDGRQAWAVIQEEPHLLAAVLNWMLPHMDGYTISKRLRERRPEVFTVVMIGPILLQEVGQKLHLHANRILMKPFAQVDIDTMAALVFQLAACSTDQCSLGA